MWLIRNQKVASCLNVPIGTPITYVVPDTCENILKNK